MSYITDFEAELRTKLNGSEGEDAVIRWICERVLESYRNGIKAGKDGTPVKRDGQSRRRGSYGKAA